MSSTRHHYLTRLFRITSKVESHELAAVALSFLMVFLLLGSYYILRPVRDGMASDWSDAELSFLWTLNFFISTAVVALYGWFVAWIRFDYLVPTVYAIFAVLFAFFYFAMADFFSQPSWLGKSFYIWMSIFSLFNISVFWSFMSDLFTKEQAGRLFPLIGAGASAGALIGPMAPTLLVAWIGTEALLLITALLILPAVPLTLILIHLKKTELKADETFSESNEKRIGGNPFSGFRDFFKSRFLIGIGLFIILYTAIGSIIYFEQKNLLAPYSLTERTQFLGAFDWIVNILSFTIAFFVTGRLVSNFGMSFTLSCLPFAMCGGLALLAALPIVGIVLGLQVLRRAGNYAVAHPAREMLFTLVSREERFKAKPVIDIVAYRGGDMVTSWGFAALTQGLGFGLGAMAAIGALIAAVWGAVGILLGRKFNH